MSKYSSYKNHQLITENWRRFLTEQDRQQHADVVKAIRQYMLRLTKATLGMDPGTGVYEPKNLGLDIIKNADADWMEDPKWRKTALQVIEDELHNVVDVQPLGRLAQKNPGHPAVETAAANGFNVARAVMFKLKQ